MTGRRFSLLAALAGLAAGLPLSAAALDYYSVAEPTVLFDAPSKQAKPRFVVARDTPLEVIVITGPWVKVRDMDGDLTWIEKSLLSPRRTVIVRAERGQVRASAADTAAIAFETERSVVLELVEIGPPGWAKVKHRDGQTGFIKAGQVWGL
jgi:SH3-like domain-containing protein